MKRIISIFILVNLFSACAYYQPIGVSTTSVGSQYERPTGIAEGVATRWYFFPCWIACPVGEDSLKAAIKNALEGKNADALVNVYAERRIIGWPHPLFPLLIMRSDVIVTGTLVKYNTKEFLPDVTLGNNEKSGKVYYFQNNENKIEDIWFTLLGLEEKDVKNQISYLSDKTKKELLNYALTKETAIVKDSREYYLFKIIVADEPVISQ